MTGILAGLYVNRETRTGAAVLDELGTRAATRDIAIDLAGATIELWPPEVSPGDPRPPRPPRSTRSSAVGGRRGTSRVRVGGRKLRRGCRARRKRIKPTVFEPLQGGGFRAVEGRELRAERLRDRGRPVWLWRE